MKETDLEQETSVWTLVGSKTYDISLICLDSLLRFSEEKIALHILSDGTLTKEQIAKFEQNNMHVINPDKELQDYIKGKISFYPNLEKVYQDGIVTMKKLVDIPVLATEVLSKRSSFNYIDSDIIFVRPFSNLFDQNETCFTFLMAPDISIGFFDLLLISRPVYSFLNSGVIQANQPDFEFADYIVDKLLQTPQKTKTFTNPWLWEQTVYSYLYTQEAQRAISRKSIYTPKYMEDLAKTFHIRDKTDSQPFGYHLVSGYKKFAKAFQEINYTNKPEPVLSEKVTPDSHINAAIFKAATGLNNRILRTISSFNDS